MDIESRADMQITNGARKGDLNHRTFPDKIPFQMVTVASQLFEQILQMVSGNECFDFVSVKDEWTIVYEVV